MQTYISKTKTDSQHTVGQLQREVRIVTQIDRYRSKHLHDHIVVPRGYGGGWNCQLPTLSFAVTGSGVVLAVHVVYV